MSHYDFGKYPPLQRHMRHLAAFGVLEPSDIKELIDSMATILERLEVAEAFVEFQKMIQAAKE